MYGSRARIGYTSPPMLTEVFPYEFYRVVPDGITLMLTTLAVLEMTSSEIDESRGIAIRVAKDMARAGANVVVLGGVPINLSLGLSKVGELMKSVADECGVPVTSSLESQMKALKQVGARRIGVIQPFAEEHSGTYDYVSEFGFELAGVKSGGYPAIDLARIPLDVAIGLSRELLHEQPDIDTLHFPCPHWAVIAALDGLEQTLHVNAISASQAIIWNSLRMCGVDDRLPGYGRLLRDS
jgi:maleate isomerase